MKWWQLFMITTASGVATAFITTRLVATRVAASLKGKPAYQVAGRLVSIIIPSLREEAYLPRVLESISNQTHTPIEVIVADSSPPPYHQQIEAICQRYQAQCINVPELNVSRARNEGARRAKGDILMFVDADCVLAPDYVERIVAALEDGYVLAHGVDPNLGGGIYGVGSIFPRKFFKPRDYTTGRGVGIWKDKFWEVGGYDEACDPMAGCREDIDLGRRVKDVYGLESIKLLQGAVVATSPRREKLFGAQQWQVRAVRGSEVIA